MMTNEMMKRLKADGTVKIEPMKGYSIKLRKAEDLSGDDMLHIYIYATVFDKRVASSRTYPYTEERAEIDTLVKMTISEYCQQLSAHMQTLYNKANNYDIAEEEA